MLIAPLFIPKLLLNALTRPQEVHWTQSIITLTTSRCQAFFNMRQVFVPDSRRLLWLQAFTKGEQVGAPTLLNEVISPSQFLVHYNNINSKRGDWAKLEEYLRQCYRSIQRELKRQ